MLQFCNSGTLSINTMESDSKSLYKGRHCLRGTLTIKRCQTFFEWVTNFTIDRCMQTIMNEVS